MTTKQIHELLKECGMQNPITIPTLGGRTTIDIRYVAGEGIKIRDYGPLAFEQAELILARFEKASPETKRQPSYYNQPRWRESPNMILAPWIAAVFYHLENSTP